MSETTGPNICTRNYQAEIDELKCRCEQEIKQNEALNNENKCLKAKNSNLGNELAGLSAEIKGLERIKESYYEDLQYQKGLVEGLKFAIEKPNKYYGAGC